MIFVRCMRPFLSLEPEFLDVLVGDVRLDLVGAELDGDDAVDGALLDGDDGAGELVAGGEFHGSSFLADYGESSIVLMTRCSMRRRAAAESAAASDSQFPSRFVTVRRF